MLKKLLLFCLVILFASNTYGQHMTYAVKVNQTDSFLFTSSAFLENDIIKGSLVSRKLPVGSASIAGEFYIGQMALRRMDSLGNEIWKVDFPSSKGRIFDIQIHDSRIIIGGAYFDTLAFDNGDTLLGNSIRSNEFVAAFDFNGNYLWSYSTPVNPNFGKFFLRFIIRNGKIYYPYTDGFQCSNMQVLSINGDSIDNVQFSNSGVLVSDMDLDSDGNLYLCGTANFDAVIGGDTVTQTQSNIFYMTFLTKLDTSMQQLWSKGFYYLTRDFHSELEIEGNRLAFLYNRSDPNNFNTINYYALSFFDLNGNLQQRDSVADGMFSHMIHFKSLFSYQGEFYYTNAKDYNVIGIYKVDSQFNRTMLTYIDAYHSVSDNWLKAKGNKLYFNMSFNVGKIVVNGSDTIWNDVFTVDSNYWNHQQLMLVIDLASCMTSLEDLKHNEGINVFPNPASTVINIQSLEWFDQLSIFNTNGRLVYRNQWNKLNGKIDLRSLNLKPGLYFLSLENNEKRVINRVLIQ